MTNVVLTHNDLDAVGCLICLKKKIKIDKLYSTNYGNLERLCNKILNDTLCDNLIIADVSFSQDRDLLIKLCEKFKKVILIDHHLVPDNFFNGINAKVFYDVNRCASKICYDIFCKDDKILGQFIDYVNLYDTWQSDDPKFMQAFYINEYLISLNKEIDGLADDLINSKYTILKNVKNFKDKYIKDFEVSRENLIKNGLMLRNKELKMTVIFSWDFFNLNLINEFKDGQEIVLGFYKGIVKVRLNKNATYSDDFRLELRKSLVGDQKYGHLNAFTYLNKNLVTTEDVIKEVKKICNYIQTYDIPF